MIWSESTKIDTVMRDVSSLGGGFITFFLSVLLYIVGKDAVAFQLLLGFALVYPFTLLIRAVHFKARPTPMKYRSFIEKLDASSFPSIHAANSFYAAYVLHSAFTSNPASAFLFFMAALVGYTRIYLKKHYPVDVIGGALTGVLAAYITTTFIIL